MGSGELLCELCRVGRLEVLDELRGVVAGGESRAGEVGAGVEGPAARADLLFVFDGEPEFGSRLLGTVEGEQE